MITDMDKWTNIRRDILAGGMSRCEACKKYNLNLRTIRKILEHQEPPGYRRKTTRVKPKIGKFIPIIHEIMEADKKVHAKQRHTGKRICERLCKSTATLEKYQSSVMQFGAGIKRRPKSSCLSRIHRASRSSISARREPSIGAARSRSCSA